MRRRPAGATRVLGLVTTASCAQGGTDSTNAGAAGAGRHLRVTAHDATKGWQVLEAAHPGDDRDGTSARDGGAGEDALGVGGATAQADGGAGVRSGAVSAEVLAGAPPADRRAWHLGFCSQRIRVQNHLQTGVCGEPLSSMLWRIWRLLLLKAEPHS